MLAPVFDLATYRRDGVLVDLAQPAREVVHAAADVMALGARAAPLEEPLRFEIVPAVASAAGGRRIHMTSRISEVQRFLGLGLDLALCGAVREAAGNVTGLAHRVTCVKCASALLAINAKRQETGGATWPAEVVVRLARRVRRAELRRWAKRRERVRGGR